MLARLAVWRHRRRGAVGSVEGSVGRQIRNIRWGLGWLAAVVLLCPAMALLFPAIAQGDEFVDLLEDPPAPDAPSLSIGDQIEGELRGGVELPRRATGLVRLSVVAARDSGWGTRDLVDLLQRVAARLQRHPDHKEVPVRVGNLSLRQGGEMRWSHSHRSGRDADLLLYLLDETGEPVAPDAFVTVNAGGVGKWKKREVRFDAPRTWRLVAELLADGHVQIQHLYLAEPLRQMVLAHARTVGAPEALVQRAHRVLSEPGHSGKHDDHLHVRLYCSRADRLAGCQDDEPRWPWVQGYDHEVRRHLDQLIAELGEADPPRRLEAIERLRWLQRQDPRAVEALVWAAAHDVAEVRDPALNALLRVRAGAAFALLLRAAREVPASAALPLVLGAVRVARREHAAELMGLLAPDCGSLGDRLTVAECSQVRGAVARAVRPWLVEEAAAPLLGLLDDPDVTTRRSALQSLAFLANRTLVDAATAFEWYEDSAHLGRLHWMVEGFALRDVAVHAPPHVLAPKLVALLQDPDEALAANAEAMLRQVLGNGPVEPTDTPARRHRAWARWWEVHRTRYDWSATLEAVRKAKDRRPGAGSGTEPAAGRGE